MPPNHSLPGSLASPGSRPANVTPGASGDPDFMLSLARGLSVIRAFAEGRQHLSVAEVARLTNLSRAAARRCLYTLAVLGYARFSDGTYELTPAVAALGQSYLGTSSVARVAQPVLDRLSTRLQSPLALAVLDGDDVVNVARVPARVPVSTDFSPGSRLPAFCTSMGRVLIASMESGARDRYLSRLKPVRRTPHTVIDKALLRAEIARVAAQGYALVEQEIEAGWRTLAVPVLRSGVTVAAVTIGAPVTASDRQTFQRETLPILRAAADEIGAALTPQI
jgi:IclR family pca regulon transcriptional regulator